ncbi:efflux RND transporter periplasmic adaptor subunit [Nannocystaceae bacterium ST9]
MASRNNKGWIRLLKWAIGLSFVAGLVAATVFAFMPKPVPVETATVVRGDLRVTVDEDGKTRVIDRYVVSAPLGGTMGRIDLHPGDPVEEGTLLATIEPTSPPLLDARTRAETEARLLAAQASKRQANAAVNRAKAAYEFAIDERDRTAKLVSKGSTSQRTLDVAELDVRTREQDLESARFGVRVAMYEVEVAKAAVARIDSAAKPKPKPGDPAKPLDPAKPDAPEGPRQDVVEVRSPVVGAVLRVLQDQEGVVQPGTPLIELADPHALELVVDVLTSDAIQIEPGAPVEIDQWGGDLPLQGRVRMVEPSAFTKISALGVEEQRVNVIIDLGSRSDASDNPQMQALGDGFRVEVGIVVWEGHDILKIPVSALFRSEQRWAVWVVDQGVASLRIIEVGRRQGLEVEVASGLEEGEQIVIHPSDAVKEGVQVDATP